MRLRLIICPSTPLIPTVADTATMLFTQIIFPTALPTNCSVRTSSGEILSKVAVSNWKEEKRMLETVLEPETNTPKTPMKGAIKMKV